VRSPLLLLAALALAACGSSDRRADAEPSTPSAASRGPDQIVLRVPRAGGRVAAYVYPQLDSAVWTSADAAPALDHVLAFDGESGLLAAVDRKGVPTRLSLREGTVRAAVKTPLADAASADGETIYGVGKDGEVVRLTPTSATWRQKLAAPVDDVFPQSDGSILVAATREGGTTIWRLRPPDTEVGDSVRLAGAGRPLSTPLGDRLYYTEGTELFGVRIRDLEPLKRVQLTSAVRDVASTPSGDRLFVVLEGASALAVVDRYQEAVERTVTLPGEARAVRVDPLGRYVLARAANADSAWVVAIGTDRVLGAVTTAWRADLPLILADGTLALAHDDDVQFVDAETLRPGRRIEKGARDFWHVVRWNGFRPRAAGLDTPVEFRASDMPMDTGLVVDSLGLPVGGDSAGAPAAPLPAPPSTRPPPRDSGASPPDAARPTEGARTAARAAPSMHGVHVALSGPRTLDAYAAPVRPALAVQPPERGAGAAGAGGSSTTTQSAGGAVTRRRAPGRGFTVQFAALDDERQARRIAARLRVDGESPLVVPGTRDGAPLYRVVLGPFPSRADAERVARASRQAYWIYEGAP
jgi:cell division septation protein DedD